MTQTRFKERVSFLCLLYIGKLAFDILVRLLIVENLFQHLEKGVRIKFEELLHEALICAEPNDVHCIETPTLLA